MPSTCRTFLRFSSSNGCGAEWTFFTNARAATQGPPASTGRRSGGFRPAAGPRARGMRPHVDLGAALLEAGRVHELVDEVDPAAAGREEVLTEDRARDRGGIEAGTGIAHDDEHSALVVA